MSDTRATARDLTPRRAEFHLWGRGAFSRAYDTYGCTRARQVAGLRNGRSGTTRQQPATSQSGHKTRAPVVWYSQPCLSINGVSFVFLLFFVRQERRKDGQFLHVNGSPTKKRKVSPNCALPSSLNTFSTGQTSRSSQKFIKRHGNGRGYSKKNR